MGTSFNWVRAGFAVLAVTCAPVAAIADSDCNQLSAVRVQTVAHQPASDTRPAYLQKTAGSFPSRCSDRFETSDARLTAARTSDRARFHPGERLNQSVALLAAGQEREAVEARNLAISDWIETLNGLGMTRFDIRKSRGGVILAVSFPHQNSENSVDALWLAVPDGPGLPAAAILRADPMRASFRALRTGREPAALTILEHRTCRDARVLRETVQPAAIESFDRIASEAMRAYLRQPETLAGTLPAEPLANCLMPEMMLHIPPAP